MVVLLMACIPVVADLVVSRKEMNTAELFEYLKNFEEKTAAPCETVWCIAGRYLSPTNYLQIFYTAVTSTPVPVPTPAPVVHSLLSITKEEMDAKLDAVVKRINERIAESELITAKLTIQLFMKKLGTWIGCSEESVDEQMTGLLQFAVKTKDWTLQFLAPIKSTVEKVLTVLGGGNNEIPLSYIALPIASSAVHLILNAHVLRSIAVGDVMLPVVWDHVVNAVLINLVSYLRSVPGFGVIGLSIATVMFCYTLFSVHWKLGRNSVDVYRSNKAAEKQAVELDRERALRNEDISSVKENLSDLWVKTNTTADDVAKVAASCEVQPAPLKAVQFIGNTTASA